MKILVTGAAGFIGSTLAGALLGRGDEVVGLDNFNDYYSPARKRANIAPLLRNPRFRLIEGDFSDPAIARDAVAWKPAAIAHIGAMGSVRYSVKNPALFVQVNIVGTANLLEAARLAGVPHFVFASTSSVYGQTDKIPFVEGDPTDRPLAPYPASKKAGEIMGYAYHNMHGMSFTALRFFNVYGPKGRPDMMPYIVTDSLVHGKEITLFDAGAMRRDWTFVGDILEGVIAAIDKPLGYEIINLGRGEPIDMNAFVHIAEEIADKKAIIRVAPAPASEPKVTFANVDKARRLLAYNPRVSVREGLARFWEWYTKEAMAPPATASTD
ncbi:MAG TPA: NAD-dependent epimerase/dehydratase family protein [Verrucomicrobiae bacterium]|nr:NAD-dependent epimerase/dehydratase family protein [Verrucomicrobiae bacterium]